MKFWEGNKLSGEFEMTESDVAKIFRSAIRAARRRVASPAAQSAQSDLDFLAKVENWPYDRTLRDWMTSPAGLNASWEDEKGYERILNIVREMGRDGF